MTTILLVEDDITFSLMLKTWLTKKGFNVDTASSIVDAKKKLDKTSYNLILSDLRLPDHDGIYLLKLLKDKNANIPLIMMTSYADVQTAVQSIKLGAFDFIAKPVNPEELLSKITEALSQKEESSSPTQAHPTVQKNIHNQGFIIGKSPQAVTVYEYIRLVAPTSMSILINGASGTGKEYIARLIHEESRRKEGPFIAVDCGAIPRELAASEFFGHIKGSFTGAIANKTGHFMAANGGTLFLDEIGNLPYEIQMQLLRVLQEKKIKPVGSNVELDVDVRIITATNEDLQKALHSNSFREDLFHRLNEFSIQVPNLKDRKEDIILFANHFLQLANKEFEKDIVGFDAETLTIFQHYTWPGNLRQLKNIIKRAALLSKGGLITQHELSQEILIQHEHTNNLIKDKESTALWDEDYEKNQIINALKQCKNNKSQAASFLRIDRKTLYNKMKLYNID
jgi:two-component system response regulator HydG